MSPNLLFVGGLALALGLLFPWAFRHLPQEHWQVLAAVPARREPEGHWRGVNLTTYGFVLASALVFATAMFLVLARSVAVPWWDLILVTGALLGLALPSASILARIIEKKRATLTVGGAVFVAFLLAPALVVGFPRWSGRELPALAILAGLGIAYNFGEGLGRLACLSFGCCYGRTVASLPAGWRGLVAPIAQRFHGSTKKVAYEAGWEGVPLVPIQAISAVVLSALGLAGCGLFLAGHFRAAFVLTLVGSQLWRAVSEVLRADHRGGGRFSAYQVMALLAVIWALALALFLPREAVPAPHLPSGLAALWQPAAVLALQGLWGLVFLYTGVSQVTASRVHLHVQHHEV